MTGFDDLHPAIRYHVVNTLGWTGLRDTQREAIAPILAGENALLLAPTAGGKTEAAALPVLSRIATNGWTGLSALYVCPLKALLNNLEPRLQRYAAFAGLRAQVWHGDVGEAVRRRILRDPPELLLTTPESLEAILISTRIDHRHLFGGVKIVVVDELHAFAGDDRGWHLRFLIARLERLAGATIQRLGLSATVGNPEDLLRWLASDRPGRVIGPDRPTTDGEVTTDFVGSVDNAIRVLSRLYRGERRLIFADSRARVEEIAAGLRAAGVNTFVSHASLSIDQRRQAEAAFIDEPDCAIVATSTLELGLDVGDLDRVVQVGAPATVSSFLQRMGRSGRRPGARRNFLFLTTDRRELLASLAIATLWREGFVEDVVPPPLPAHIYAQQIMALVLQEGGITRADLQFWLGDALQAIPDAIRIAVLDHMLATGILIEDSGVIGFGELGEREFGRRYFSDLVAAFSTPLLLTVVHGLTDLGSVHPASLTRNREDAASVLLLGGRSWKVIAVDWRKREVRVAPMAEGGRSRWLGTGRMMSPDICGTAERIVAGHAPMLELSNRARDRLEQIRDTLFFIDGLSLPITISRTESHSNVEATVWLFGGGLSSMCLAQAIKLQSDRISSWDDFAVKVPNFKSGTELISHVGAATYFSEYADEVCKSLKFGLCLPGDIAHNIIATRLSPGSVLDDRISRNHRLVYDPVLS